MATTNIVTPPPLVGFGTLSVAVASVAVSGLTLGPNSAAFPVGSPPNGYMSFRNSIDSANNIYIAPLGGTAATATCIPLAPGESKTIFIQPANSTGSLTSPSVISGGTATLEVEW